MNLNLAWYRWKLNFKGQCSKLWQGLNTSISYFSSSESLNAKYIRKAKAINREQAITWMAEDIANYMIQSQASTQYLILCDFASEEYVGQGYTFHKNFFFKRQKTKMAYYKYNMDISLQNEIVDRLKQNVRLKIKEKRTDYEGHHVKGYYKTFIISKT